MAMCCISNSTFDRQARSIDKYGQKQHSHHMRSTSILIAIALFGTTPALAVPVAQGCKEAAAPQAKAPVRKPVEPRKRASSPSVVRGCVGCIVPLDGISSTMAVHSLG
jgi:hypothetical protein